MAKSRMTLAQKHKLTGFFFSLPFIIGFILFFLAPLIRSIYYSFFSIKGLDFKYIGLDSYNSLLFVNPYIIRLIVNTLKNFAFIFPAILLYALFIAVILNAKFKGRIFFRIIFFIPIVLNSGLVQVNMNDAFMQGMAGILSGQASADMTTVNLTQAIIKYLPFGEGSLFSIVEDYVKGISSIVNMSSIQVLIYLAGLQTISPSIYEASNIEGASAWYNFWKITFPMMSPYILVNAVFTVIDQLAGQSNTIVMYLRSIMFEYMGSDLGVVFALSWIYLPVILIIIGFVVLVINRYVHYEND